MYPFYDHISWIFLFFIVLMVIHLETKATINQMNPTKLISMFSKLRYVNKTSQGGAVIRWYSQLCCHCAYDRGFDPLFCHCRVALTQKSVMFKIAGLTKLQPHLLIAGDFVITGCLTVDPLKQPKGCLKVKKILWSWQTHIITKQSLSKIFMIYNYDYISLWYYVFPFLGYC